MKLAYVNGERREPEKGLLGVCVGCEQPMVPKCGPIKVKHWAHKSKCECDHWWENETEWHRSWKNNFPIEWQEIVHAGKNGEKHIADVRTEQGWVLEFQNSPISPEERLSRDIFYGKIVWVVNGLRRKTDVRQFMETLNSGFRISDSPVIRKIQPHDCTLLAEWSLTQVPVFFDLGEETRIWWFLPVGPNGKRDYIGAFSRQEFIELHKRGQGLKVQEFENFLNEFSRLIVQRDSQMQRHLAGRNTQSRWSSRSPRRHFRF